MKTSKNKKRKVAPSIPYEPFLIERLKDIDYCVGYLNACIDGDTDGDFEVFFNALEKVARAQGFSTIALKTKRSRDTFYKAFKGHHNPTLKTFSKLLHTMNMQIAIVPRQRED